MLADWDNRLFRVVGPPTRENIDFRRYLVQMNGTSTRKKSILTARKNRPCSCRHARRSARGESVENIYRFEPPFHMFTSAAHNLVKTNLLPKPAQASPLPHPPPPPAASKPTVPRPAAATTVSDRPVGAAAELGRSIGTSCPGQPRRGGQQVVARPHQICVGFCPPKPKNDAPCNDDDERDVRATVVVVVVAS